MRKIVLSLAAAGAALLAASPAAAQYYPQPQPAPYGNAYGYNNGFWHGAVRCRSGSNASSARSTGSIRRDRIGPTRSATACATRPATSSAGCVRAARPCLTARSRSTRRPAEDRLYALQRLNDSVVHRS